MAALTTAELLAEAKAAYHALMTGQSVAEARDSDGQTVRYTQANVTRLKVYIAELEALLSSKPPITGPLRPIFG